MEGRDLCNLRRAAQLFGSGAIVAGILAMAGLSGAHAQTRPSDSEIDAVCEEKHPNFLSDFFARNRCVSEAKEKWAAVEREQKEKERQAAREERARPCISDALPTLESTLSRIRDRLKDKTRLDEVKAVIEAETKQKTAVAPSDHNIKEKVLVGILKPACDTAFYFLINVLVSEQGDLRSFRVWAEAPPKGYSAGVGPIGAFTLDWEAERRSAELAAKERETRQLEKAALQKVSLINLEAKCVPRLYGQASTTCGQIRFNFGVVNRSNEPIYAISFGWNFLSGPLDECPVQLVTKKTERSAVSSPPILIGPSETRWFSIESEPLPDSFRTIPTWCFRITQIKISP